MAKATLSVELKNNTAIEVRVHGRGVKTQTQRHEFSDAIAAQAAMIRATEWVLDFAKTGKAA